MQYLVKTANYIYNGKHQMSILFNSRIRNSGCYYNFNQRSVFHCQQKEMSGTLIFRTNGHVQLLSSYLSHGPGGYIVVHILQLGILPVGSTRILYLSETHLLIESVCVQVQKYTCKKVIIRMRCSYIGSGLDVTYSYCQGVSSSGNQKRSCYSFL